jgi:hypothetical protein
LPTVDRQRNANRRCNDNPDRANGVQVSICQPLDSPVSGTLISAPAIEGKRARCNNFA